jgi:hypothetical protein
MTIAAKLFSIGRGELAEFVRPVLLPPHGKILVAARFAAVGRNAKEPPQKRKRSRNVIGGDALQVQIAANGTVGAERLAERHEPRVESCLALPATPRKDTEETEHVVNSGLAARASRVLALTKGADHLGGWKPLELGTE